MAEFVRIWEPATRSATQDDVTNGLLNTSGNIAAVGDDIEDGSYVEYDTTTILTETVGIPVTPVGFSRDVNVGIIQKVIDTNDITAGTQSVEISQILRPVTVEKSDANRFSIQTSIANQINIDSKRNEILINTSGVGQRGAKGDKGDPSITEFNPTALYKRGDIVLFESENWVARESLNGVVSSLDNPVEGDSWTQIADHRYIQDLPLTSGFEISTQAEWEALEPTIELGDVIKVSNELENNADNLTITLTNATQSYQIAAAGIPVETDGGLQFFATGTRVGSAMLIEATNGSDFTVADFIDAIGGTAALGATVFFQGNDFGVLNVTGFTIESVALNRTSPTVQVLVEYAGVGGNYSAFGSALVNGFNVDTRLFEGSPNGIQINEVVTELGVGDRINIVGERATTSQTIIRRATAPNRTYYDIRDYSGYEVGKFIIGEVITQQTLSAGQWYARNTNIRSDLDKLDSLATDLVLKSDVETLKSYRSGVGDPAFLEKFTRNRASSFFGVNSNTANPRPFTVSDNRRIKLLINRTFGGVGVNEGGDGYSNLISLLGVNYAGIQDGAQVNVVKSVDESGALDLDDAFRLSTTAESNVIDSFDTSKFSVVTETDSDGNVTTDRELRTVTERNAIDHVEPNSVLTIFSDTNTNRELRSTAEKNIISGLHTSAVNGDSNTLTLQTVTVDGESRQFVFSNADKNLPTSTTGGSGEGNKLILLNDQGIIPSTAISQINLSDVTVFLTVSARNAFTDKAWGTGDTAIVAGIPGLFLATDPFSEGGTTLKLDSTDDLPISGQINLRFGDNFKRVNFTDNDTATDTLTVVSSTFVAGDIAKFPSGLLGTSITTATGTFVYLSSDQIAGTPPATVGQVTTNADWAEIVPTGGVATSVNGASGVVSLSGGNLDGVITDNSVNTLGSLNELLSGLSVRVSGNDTDIATINGSGNIEEKQTKLTFVSATGDIVNDGSTSVRAGDLFTALGLTTGETGLSFDTSPTSGSRDLVRSGDLFTEFETKQDNLSAGTGINPTQFAAGTIAVDNVSGVQVTVFAFQRVDGDTVRMTKYENGDTINVEDLIDTHILVDGLDTELYNIAGTCSVTDSLGDTITNAQECQQTSGTWRINPGPATLQRIT